MKISKKQLYNEWLPLFALALLLLFIGFFVGQAVESKTTYSEALVQGFTTNEHFIESLNAELNTSDHIEVFDFVFSQLDDEVTVYPSENFYYYKFIANGKTYGGALGLSTRDRDDGVFHFGYIARPEFGRTDILKKSDDGGGKPLTSEDGVLVERIDGFTYTVTYKGKTVVFNMYQPGLTPPDASHLREEEVYVGPVVDESGLQFYLLFNQATPHMYHMLNEDIPVHETFESYGQDILIGERTNFAFYNDVANNRKIVIGVEASHVLNNDWYDGPFDHMPDNYIALDLVEFQSYVEAAYPGTAGRINKHARYTERNGTRVAIAPYTVYYEKQALQTLVTTCKTLHPTTSPLFYACITQQVFEGPSQESF